MILHGRELLKAEVIWDRDHGRRLRGWYLRTTWSDGQIEDDVVPAIQDVVHGAPDGLLVAAAVLWLHDPDGMTDADREELRGMIEVKR